LDDAAITGSLIADEERRAIESRLTRNEIKQSLDIDSIKRRAKLISKCEFGMNVLAVTAKGDAYPCVGAVGRRELFMGNIHVCDPAPTRQIIDLYRRNVVTRRVECNGCWAKYICAGGCMIANRTMAGSYLGTSTALCDF
jgi:radical SAM protein with 4Fe4S-binding SPASM domain